MLFLTKRRVLCTHILEAYIFKDFNNRKIPLNINPLNYIISVEICSLQAIVLSYRRKIRSLIYHKLNVRLHFTHSDTNIIFLPICIIVCCALLFYFVGI